MQNKSSLNQKFLLILFGLLIASLLAEGLFRIGGVLVHKTMLEKNPFDNEKTNTILCLGDSSTFGIGASNYNENSYPAQLQKILNNRNIDNDFKVINGGIPGSNSSQLLHRLRKNILKYKPALLIVQIGENDYWNLNESNIAKYYDVPLYKRVLLGTELFLNYSKLFRFIKLVSVSSKTENYVEDNTYDDTIPVTDSTKGRRYRFSLTDPASTIAYTRLINENFTKMEQIAKEHNTRIIFLRYHIGGYRSIHFYQEQIFSQLNVPYVNNRQLFVEAEKRGINPFGHDKWHPGDDGYLLIAKNIYNKMVSLGIIEGVPFKMFE